MVIERFLVFFFLISFVLFGCSIISNDSDDEVVTTQPTTTTKTISGKIEFPASAGTTASIRAAITDFSLYEVYINDTKVTLNPDGTFTGNVPEADEYDIQVRKIGSTKAVLQLYVEKGEEETTATVDIKTTAHAIAYQAYKANPGNSGKNFNNFKQIMPGTAKEIEELAEVLETVLKSVTNLQTDELDYTQISEVISKTVELVQIAEEEEKKQAAATTSSTTTTTTSTATSQPLSNVIAVSAGSDFSLALKSDGTVWTWGADGSGQLGNGEDDSDTKYFPVQVGVITEGEVRPSIRAGVVTSSSSSSTSSSTATSAPLTNVVAISAGYSHSLALKSDGTVYAWGNNENGECGQGDESESNYYLPVQIPDLGDVVAIATGELTSFFLKSDGSVWACGYNEYGELGDGIDTGDSYHEPFQIKGYIQAFIPDHLNFYHYQYKCPCTIRYCGYGCGLFV
ncbi:RCC1 domain-containing protein [Candidatus Riflebacteria bacterium]